MLSKTICPTLLLSSDLFFSAGKYPLFTSRKISRLTSLLSSKFIITTSLSTISTSLFSSKSEDNTSLGPLTFKDNFCVWLLEELNVTFFKFIIISVTSSLTPSMVENSWSTPLILIDVIAVPWSEERRTLLKALPRVVPKPFSNGSIITVPNFLFSLILYSTLLGLTNEIQLFSITSYLLKN